jgi:hypothetical protein
VKKTLLILIVFLLMFTSALSQYVARDGSELLKLKKIPQEKAYLDHTGPVVFSGEYLYYSFFCFNTQNNKLSNISKIGYVALVNESKEYVSEQKLRLDNGTASGDVFIPMDIPSGKYKLLGYTQWMKNSGVSQIFKDDIIIINPYLANQSALLGNNTNSTSSIIPEVMGTVAMDSSISIQVNGYKFGNREKVGFSIRNYKNKLGYGTYSVKVIKKENLGINPNLSAINYGTEYLNVDKEIPQSIGDSLFLPEQRGELFFGSILDRVTNEPVPDVPVVLSIPGKEYLLKFSQSDKSGNFYSYLRKEYKNDVAILQAEVGDRSYIINKVKLVDLDISNLKFADFTMSKAYGDDIIKRSVHNQIENQFFAAKPDSIIQGDPIGTFDGGVPEVFVLDDYTRFPTFEETILEIVKFTRYRRGGGVENDYVRVAQDFESDKEEYNSFPAIVLFDGVFVPNHENVKDYDARKIDKIGVISDQFRMGGKDYQGIVSVETFDGDFYEGYSAENTVSVALSPPVQKKNYFTQTYSDDDSTYARVPDYRTLLLWKPHVEIQGPNMNFEFYTSDIEGEYEIILNGFTTYGKPISISKSIEVSSLSTKL